MTIKRQEQDVGSGSLAIQSGGDTHINSGLSSQDMRAIVEAVADQIPKYAAIAGQIVDQRLKSFEEKIINRFETDKQANTEAFKDPDFQYLLGRAQHAYARSGKEEIGDSLADLISERSKSETQSRLSLSLNGAVERVPLLTREEFAELSLTFLIRRVLFTRLRNIADLAAVLTKHALPLLDDISSNESSYTYLESVGCAKLSVMDVKLSDVLGHSYYFLRQSVPYDNLANATSRDFAQSLVDAGLTELDPSSRLVRHTFHSEDQFLAAVNNVGLDNANASRAWSEGAGSPMTKESVIALLEPHLPDTQKLFEVWDSTPIKQLELSSVGTVIGFSNLRRISGFDGNLSVWVS